MTEAAMVSTDVPAGFVRLSDVYAMSQNENANHDYDYLLSEWFPEVGALFEGRVFGQIVGAGRLCVRSVAHVDHDYCRITSVQTLWLDGEPFAVVQRAGRGGRDFGRRIVTDERLLQEALSYLLEQVKIDTDAGTFRAPDYAIPVEEIFDFYNSGVAKNFGLEAAPARRDLFEFGGDWREDHLRPILENGEILIVALGVEPVGLLRSGDSYYGLKRAITTEDFGKVKNLDAFVASFGKAEGVHANAAKGYVYVAVKTRPDNFAEAVPL
jgi:hypothetical protein